MRTLVLVAVIAAGCGSRPAPVTPPSTPTPDVPLATTTQIPASASQPPQAERPLPPPRVFPVAWHTANAGKETYSGDSVVFRADGSLVVIGQGDADRWAAKKSKKRPTLIPYFVAALDASGKPQWVHTLDVGSGGANGVAEGPDRSVLVTGWFTKTLQIDGKVVATSAGDGDIFLARFEADGRLAWAVRAGSKALDLAQGIAVAANGMAYIVGSISGDATFGNLSARHIGARDVFVAAFDPKGEAQWVGVGGGTESDEARAVTLTQDSICVTGLFGGVAKFQGVTLTMPAPEPNKLANPSNAFVVCHSKSGDVKWADRIGTHTAFDAGWDIASLSDGSVVVTGDSEDRPFVARYAPAGERLWLRHATGDGAPRAVVALAGDEILVAMYLVGGELAVPGNTRNRVVRARGSDTVLAHYTADGEILATAQIAGVDAPKGDERNGDEIEIASMAVSSTGRVALTGRAWGEAMFEAGDLLAPTPAKVTGPSGRGLILVVLDPLVPSR